MSGSSTTTFVPSRYRAAYLPRIPLRKSYSGRIVSRSVDRLVLFLTGSSCSAGRPPRTDHPDRLAAFRMSDNEEPPTVRETQKQEPLFVGRVVGITDRHRQRVIEYRCGLAEPDTMLAARSTQPSEDPTRNAGPSGHYISTRMPVHAPNRTFAAPRRKANPRAPAACRARSAWALASTPGGRRGRVAA
jgi:hypothetical protein